MSIDPQQDAFLRMAITGLSASAHGVSHKSVSRDRIIARAQDIALLLWDKLQAIRPDTGEEWAAMKVDAVAYASNMLAHNINLDDISIVRDAVECAQIKWQAHQQWRALQ